MKFSEINLSPELRQAIADLKFETMTMVQEKSIPLLRAGDDLIVQSETGTGKTAAYAIPMIESIDLSQDYIQALVVVPTRELSKQVCNHIEALVTHIPDFRMLSLYGGRNFESQKKSLNIKPHLLISTPGRINDLLDQSLIDISKLKFLILDEADTIIEMGLKESLDLIFDKSPASRQTAMFSATHEANLIKISHKYLARAKHINFAKKKSHDIKISHNYIVLDEVNRLDAIKRIVFSEKVFRSIIFANNKVVVDKVFKILKKQGFKVAALHGDLKPNKRDLIMERFKNFEINILVASDIAARGMDIPDLDLVFNFQLPREDRDYTHRVGRTGRAGNEGKAITFVNNKEIKFLKSFATKLDLNIDEAQVPRIDSLDIVSVDILKNIIIDSCLTKGEVKKQTKKIEVLEAEFKGQNEFLSAYQADIVNSSEHVLGAGFR